MSDNTNTQDNMNADSRARRDAGRRYWQGVQPSLNGMLGGLPHITKVDLRASRAFLAKLGFGCKPGLRIADAVLEGGAGIGRVTDGLLLECIARQVDVIEPIAKFTAKLEGLPGVRNIFNVGLEDWQPPAEPGTVQYDLVWVQWCVGHVTDEQLVRFLERCKTVLNPEGGLIVVKENNSTCGEDDFDPLDSSVTRDDSTFRHIFAQAGLRLVQVELQKSWEKGLLPVRMYALEPEL